jgi:L-aminopeptidase/D-esterase-like protein
MKEEAAFASKQAEPAKERNKDGSIIIIIATDVGSLNLMLY